MTIMAIVRLNNPENNPVHKFTVHTLTPRNYNVFGKEENSHSTLQEELHFFERSSCSFVQVKRV